MQVVFPIALSVFWAGIFVLWFRDQRRQAGRLPESTAVLPYEPGVWRRERAGVPLGLWHLGYLILDVPLPAAEVSARIQASVRPVPWYSFFLPVGGRAIGFAAEGRFSFELIGRVSRRPTQTIIRGVIEPVSEGTRLRGEVTEARPLSIFSGLFALYGLVNLVAAAITRSRVGLIDAAIAALWIAAARGYATWVRSRTQRALSRALETPQP